MRIARYLALFVFATFLASPLLEAQALSKYRNFSFGMKLAAVLKHTDKSMTDVRMIHGRPVLLQELTWWPPAGSGSLHQTDAVQQILFSFYNGELYRVFVTYDPTAVEGLTGADMVQSISVLYGPPTNPVHELNPPATKPYDQQNVASWEDSQYSLKLVRSSFSGGFELILFSKSVNAAAETSITAAGQLEEQERPQKDADRRKKEAADLEAARQKNRKVFQP